MSDLQLALLALGAVIIASVLLFNWWQERKLSRETVRRFEGPVDDALLEEFRMDSARILETEEKLIIEETYDTGKLAVQGATKPAHAPFMDDEYGGNAEETTAPEASLPPREDEHEPPQAFAPATHDDYAAANVASVADAAPVKPTSAANNLPAELDQQIDLVALVHLNALRNGETLREALMPLPEFDKPTQWLGEAEAGGWRHLTRDQAQIQFIRMACALQLADRSGPVTDETLRNFQLKVEEIASNLGATVEWRSATDPHRYARELDQFCVEVDVMIGFHIIHGGNGPFAGTKLRGLAEASGMKLREDGNFHSETENGATLFMMINQDQRPFTPETLRTAFVRGVTFQLDVPRVPNCTEIFSQMVLVARQMESSLGGRLVDDNQRPLGDAEIDQIRQQLKAICARMLARGIMPGTSTALRLFS